MTLLNQALKASILILAISGCSSSSSGGREDLGPATPITAVVCSFGAKSTSTEYFLVLQRKSNGAYYVRTRFVAEGPSGTYIGLRTAWLYPAAKGVDVVTFSRKRSDDYRGMERITNQDTTEINLKTGVVTSTTFKNGVADKPYVRNCNYSPGEMDLSRQYEYATNLPAFAP